MPKRFFSVFFLLAVFAVGVTAQSAEQAAKSARDRFNDLKIRSIEMERMKREANKRPVADNSPRFPEIKEDFEAIQKLNSRLLELTADKTPSNYAALIKSASEINQRASRLKSNLFSDEVEIVKSTKNESPNIAQTAAIKTLTDHLDQSINSFVHSSLFQNINLVNSKDSLKAQNDLETVIKVSSLIKEKARRLKKEKPRATTN